MKSEVMRRNGNIKKTAAYNGLNGPFYANLPAFTTNNLFSAPVHNDPSAAASCFYDGGHSIV